MHPTLCTIVRTPANVAVAIYYDGRDYRVGLIPGDMRLHPCECAQFWTYDAAHVRMEHELSLLRNATPAVD